MASSLAFKRFVASNIFPKSLLRSISPITTVPSTSRLFNTNAIRNFDDHDDERGLDADSRSDGSVSRRRGDFLSDVFDPFFPTRSLSQVLSQMDQLMDNPFLPASRGNISRRGWDAKETDDALHLRIDMPGLGKEDVKVFVEQNTLVLKGEGEKESDEEESVRRYTSRIVLPEKVYKTNEIKAEMKNGVLKVVVPKVMEEERAHVVHVNVD